MKTMKLTVTEISELQPTATTYAAERGQVLGGIEVSGDIDHSALSQKVTSLFGAGAEMDGEGHDGEECVHWVIIAPK